MVVTIKLELKLDTLIEAITSLDLESKQKLWSILDQQIQVLKVEDSNEIMTVEEITASEQAWNDYINKNDMGISSQDLKRKIFS